MNGGRSNNAELQACVLPGSQTGMEADQLPQPRKGPARCWACERRASVVRAVWVMKCSMLWPSCGGKEGHVPLRLDASVCMFLCPKRSHCLLCIFRCPRRTKGKRPHYPRACSRNRGIRAFHVSKHPRSPLGLLAGGDVPGWALL